MQLLRILLLPISFIYGAIVTLRNVLFNFNLLPSKTYETPIVVIGNLSVGGTGKTPHTEYIVRLLQNKFNLAVLSRGYKRKSSGFILADDKPNPTILGDEPAQMATKFPKLSVAVDSNRNRGIKKLIASVDNLHGIILDDAFQHRYVNAGLNILLTTYQKPYINDLLLPTGTLREPKAGSKRADIIIVTKTPKIFSPLERRMMRTQLNPKPYQKIYFSYYNYGDLIPLYGSRPARKDYFDGTYSLFAVCGIARPAEFFYYLKNRSKEIIEQQFGDHHDYTHQNIEQILKIFDNIVNENKIIVVTEKDAIKLKSPKFQEVLKGKPIYYLPIEVKFHETDEEEFNEQITKYVSNNKIYSGVHQK